MKPPKDETGIIAVVARNVRSFREAADLSQEELAFEAGVDRTYVSQIERRQKNITITVLAKIAVALRRSPDELVRAKGRRRR